MTEKRFTLEEFGLNFIVNDNGRNLTAKQTVDKLNQLYEENEQLRLQLNLCSDQRNEFHRGARENANALGLYERKVKETLQWIYNDSKVLGSKERQETVKMIAEELGVDLK